MLLLLCLCKSPTQASTPSCALHQTTLRCRGLNTSADIRYTERDIAETVDRVEIFNSSIECLELSDFRKFQKLQEIEMTDSELKQVICSDPRVRYKKAAPYLRHLRFLNLSFNALSVLDNSITNLLHLEKIDISNNNLRQINCRFSIFKALKYLDISNNKLTKKIESRKFPKPPKLSLLS